jgi:hypothetical protein
MGRDAREHLGVLLVLGGRAGGMEAGSVGIEGGVNDAARVHLIAARSVHPVLRGFVRCAPRRLVVLVLRGTSLDEPHRYVSLSVVRALHRRVHRVIRSRLATVGADIDVNRKPFVLLVLGGRAGA